MTELVQQLRLVQVFDRVLDACVPMGEKGAYTRRLEKGGRYEVPHEENHNP